MMIQWPSFCDEDYVARIVAKLGGAAGLSGVDDETLKGWLLLHRIHSEAIRDEICEWVQWLSNGLLPYIGYQVLNAGSGLVA